MGFRGRRENSPGPYTYAQDVCHHVWDLEGMFCTLDDKECSKPFCFSLQHGVEHGKRLCPCREGAGSCGCNSSISVSFMALQCDPHLPGNGSAEVCRLHTLFCSWCPNTVPALHTQGQGWKHPALHQGLCSLVLICLCVRCVPQLCYGMQHSQHGIQHSQHSRVSCALWERMHVPVCAKR